MSPREQWKALRGLKRLWLLACLPAALLLYVLSHAFTPFAEVWARFFYPVFAFMPHLLTRFLPFSLAEWLVVLLPAAAVGLAAWGVVQVCRRRGKRLLTALRNFVITPAAAASALLLAFMVTCGTNYGRVSFAQASGLEMRPTASSELQALCTELTLRANDLRASLPEDEAGGMALSRPVREEAALAARALQALSGQYLTLGGWYGSPKPVLFSRAMSYLDITGVFFPFTMEANVNVDVVDYNIPFTMCHELSHLRGYMREDEANFIAYLACRAAGNADFDYSGTMLAFVYSINALAATDPARVAEVYAQMDPAVLRDLNLNNAYWEQFATPVATFSENVNSAYIQANGDPDGVHSYGRMVDLLLAWRRAGNKI